MKTPIPMNRSARRWLRIFIIAAGILTAGAAASVPWFFESPSLFYKLGTDRLLLQAGKASGLIAAVLIVFQVIPVARFRGLEQVFPLKTLHGFHRNSGKAIAVLAVIHPLLILASEDFVGFPFEKRYWPEYLGAGLLVWLLLVVCVSIWRKQLKLSATAWRSFHRWGTPLVVVMALVHVRYVSESFASGVPLIGLLTLGGLAAAVFIGIYIRRYILK